MSEEKVSFEINGEEAIMTGVIDHSTIQAVKDLIKNNPEVKTIVMKNVPGSIDDESNLEASRLVRAAGLNTYVPADGMIASGGTDFFCAGINRTIESGAEIGVHSWAGEDVSDASDASILPENDPEHLKYLAYYDEMGIPKDFYWFTIQAAPADRIHNMSDSELVQFKLVDQVVQMQNSVGGTEGDETLIPEFEIIKNKAPAEKAFAPFEKYINVFGLNLYAMKDVPDIKLKHAAIVMAEYLDNDENGVIDNSLVHEGLLARKATMVLFKNENRAETFFDKNGRALDILMEKGYMFQDLYASEIFEKGSSEGKFDATLEEILHTITQNGYAVAYPDIFGESSESQIAKAMDTARGGYFETIPKKYPASAWYSYYDDTADYATMITEYTYWSLTSILEGQSHDGRLDEIGDEWKLNTKEKVMNQDKVVYELLTNSEYKLPATLPNGHYSVAK